MVRIVLFVFIFLQIQFAWAQTFEGHRVTTWEKAGLSSPLVAPENEVDITDFGADHTGISSCDLAYQNAIASLNADAGTIYFPAGEYYFTSTLSIPNDVFLKGESAATTLRFDLGGSGDLIQIVGSMSSTQIPITSNATKGDHELELESTAGLEVGDVIRLFQFDEDVMFSSWAYGTLGQLVEIESIDGNEIALSDNLNHHYPLSRSPFIKRLNPRRNAGVECLTIIREDATTGQTSNINISNAVNCVVRNVESSGCNFAHLEVNASAHLQIEGNYFHHAHAYGGGGQGYGVAMQTASSFNLIQNNIFEHLRHSMLIQSGANGNVFGYNYSNDPYWEDGFLPSNSAGDAVLHGNYTYLNLFEGNTVQNMVVDASHGSNGPFNTFFRNRGELYGFFSDSGTPTDSMNVVGNEITNSGFPYGLFMLNGNGHYSFGNNVYGTVTPSNTSNVAINSLYLNGNLPDFLGNETLPMIGYPLSMNEKELQPEIRFSNDQPINCVTLLTAIDSEAESTSAVRLQGEELRIEPGFLPASVSIYSSDGKLVKSVTVASTVYSLKGNVPRNALLLIHVQGTDGTTEVLKTVL
jgi:hypothetical protein